MSITPGETGGKWNECNGNPERVEQFKAFDQILSGH